jgi:hypothetical protein
MKLKLILKIIMLTRKTMKILEIIEVRQLILHQYKQIKALIRFNKCNRLHNKVQGHKYNNKTIIIPMRGLYEIDLNPYSFIFIRVQKLFLLMNKELMKNLRLQNRVVQNYLIMMD